MAIKKRQMQEAKRQRMLAAKKAAEERKAMLAKKKAEQDRIRKL